MRCLVKVTGELSNCKVVSEDPAGKGFGQAELKLASRMHMKPPVRDGHPVEGLVTIPFKWLLAPPPTTPAASAPQETGGNVSDR
jgi:periplasmic protein TonB